MSVFVNVRFQKPERLGQVHTAYFVCAHRTSVLDATGDSPFYVLYEREPRLPIDVILLPLMISVLRSLTIETICRKPVELILYSVVVFFWYLTHLLPIYIIISSSSTTVYEHYSIVNLQEVLTHFDHSAWHWLLCLFEFDPFFVTVKQNCACWYLLLVSTFCLHQASSLDLELCFITFTNKIALSSKYAFSATFKLKWHF